MSEGRWFGICLEGRYASAAAFGDHQILTHRSNLISYLPATRLAASILFTRSVKDLDMMIHVHFSDQKLWFSGIEELESFK
jgi:hypothetical protein